jgi:hypothetical protein
MGIDYAEIYKQIHDCLVLSCFNDVFQGDSTKLLMSKRTM